MVVVLSMWWEFPKGPLSQISHCGECFDVKIGEETMTVHSNNCSLLGAHSGHSGVCVSGFPVRGKFSHVIFGSALSDSAEWMSNFHHPKQKMFLLATSPLSPASVGLISLLFD